MHRIFASLLVFATLIVAPLTSSAVPITVPTGLAVGQKYRLAFMTSTLRDASSTDIADYNAFVTLAAGGPELAALGTTWKAIASTPTVNAKVNTETNTGLNEVPIYRLDDTRIANGDFDLWSGSLAVPLAIYETGEPVFPNPPTDHWVWTGTQSNGTISASPLGATNPLLGSWEFGVASWIDATQTLPNTELHALYAISGVLTVVPEPSSIALAAWGWRRGPFTHKE